MSKPALKGKSAHHGDLERVHSSELSTGRQALDGADVVPGNLATPTNPERKPPSPRDPLSRSATAIPERPFELETVLQDCPFGMSVEHILGMVDHDLEIFSNYIRQPPCAEGRSGIRLGTFRKPDGSIRGKTVL